MKHVICMKCWHLNVCFKFDSITSICLNKLKVKNANKLSLSDECFVAATLS